MDYDALTAELCSLRERVSGVTDTLVAAIDGLLIAADTAPTLDPEGVSALAAADLGLARRTTAAIGQGTFRQTVVHSSGGYMAVYAVGPMALMVVLGDEGLDIHRLHLESQPVIERIDSLLSTL
ncbi:roadblock/LC7 domain-containing protein [Saccharothrix sp. NPDC042600]|uniref:roadblock/LC7 domain-containing protein n=1 Tax=Saccharothrix TaxID=2071 RepID=UPI00340781B6|nr:roadblock/LC7 domain-containing protein [Saccharothrix mutabilis subsp. capreolus]